MTDWDPEYNRMRGSAFREARKSRGEDIHHAAARLGISVAYLSRLERGKERWPEGENCYASDPCHASERAPSNLMDFPDFAKTLWLMAGHGARDAPWPWWCRDCGWPLTAGGLHFQVEIQD